MKDEDHYYACPACIGTGKGQGETTYCGYCGGDGSVPKEAVIQFRNKQKDYGKFSS